jgi:hypothetical protein
LAMVAWFAVISSLGNLSRYFIAARRSAGRGSSGAVSAQANLQAILSHLLRLLQVRTQR